MRAPVHLLPVERDKGSRACLAFAKSSTCRSTCRTSHLCLLCAITFVTEDLSCLASVCVGDILPHVAKCDMLMRSPFFICRS